MYEHLMIQDGFEPLSKRETLITSMQPIRSRGALVDELAAGRDAQHTHVMRHLAYVFGKVKGNRLHQCFIQRIGCKYLEHPPFHALRRAYGYFHLPFVFVEMEASVMNMLNIQKPSPPPLQNINSEDAGTNRVGHVTPVPSTIQDMSVTFGATSQNVQKLE